MKTVVSISFLLLFLVSTVAFTQTDRQAVDNRTDSTREDNREQHNYGWIGLLGLPAWLVFDEKVKCTVGWSLRASTLKPSGPNRILRSLAPDG